MAVTNSADTLRANITATKMISAAMRVCGVLDRHEDPTAEELDTGIDALNMLLKNLSGYQDPIYKIEDISITLTADKRSYTVGEESADVSNIRPLKVTDAYVRDSAGQDYRVHMMDRREYDDIWGKTSGTSRVANIHYFASEGNGTVFVYPAPNAAYASSDTLHIVALTPIEDIDNGTDTLDLSNAAFRAIKFALAYDLVPEYRVSERRASRISELKTESMQLWRAEDNREPKHIIPTRF